MDQNPNDISRNTQQTQDAQAGEQQTTQTSQTSPTPGPMPQKAKFDFKKYKLPIIIAAVAVVVIVVAIVVLVNVLGGATLDIGKYYAIKVDGFNGHGVASIEQISDPSEDPELVKALGLDEIANGDFSSLSDLSSLSDAYLSAQQASNFFSSLDYELDQSEDLSNGDKVTAQFTYDENAADQLKLKVKNATLTLTVEGLEEGTSIDPFEGLEFTYDGISPDGSVEVSNNSTNDMIRRITYDVEPSYGLANGDEIVVTAYYDESYALENGYDITQDSKTYQVEGLPYYMDENTTLTDAQKTSIESECKDAIDALLASDWDNIYDDFGQSVYADKISVSDPVLNSGYVLTVKNPDDWYDSYNKIILIYSVTIEAKKRYDDDAAPESRSGFVAVTAEDVTIDGETVTIDDMTDSVYSSGFAASNDVANIVSDLVTAEKTDYIVLNWPDLTAVS